MTALLLVALLVCIAAAITDLRRGTIPNALTYPLLALSPFIHFGRALAAGESFMGALAQAGLSVLGIVACGVIPLFMWRRGAIGGGDTKLFAGLGGLLLPRFGFEVEMYVFIVAALMAPAKIAYEGRLLAALKNMAVQVTNPFRPKHARRELDPALLSWFRLGPCFALGLAAHVVLHWRPL